MKGAFHDIGLADDIRTDENPGVTQRSRQITRTPNTAKAERCRAGHEAVSEMRNPPSAQKKNLWCFGDFVAECRMRFHKETQTKLLHIIGSTEENNMNKIGNHSRIRNLLISCIIICCCILSMSSARGQSLTMGFNENTSKPFKWKVKEKYVGAWLDITRALFEHCGMEVKLKPLPLKRLLLYLEKGQLDGVFGLYKTVEREKYVIYLNTPISWVSTDIFVQKGKEFPFEKTEDLYGKKIGMIRGHSLGDRFDIAIREGKLKVQEATNYEQNVEKLLLGRINAIVGPGQSFQALINEMKRSEQIIKLPNSVSPPRPLFIGLSKAADLADKNKILHKIEKILQDMADRGKLDKITQKFGYDYNP